MLKHENNFCLRLQMQSFHLEICEDAKQRGKKATTTVEVVVVQAIVCIHNNHPFECSLTLLTAF